MRTPEERQEMVAVLKNLQSQGQSRDLQIELIEKAAVPDYFAPDYKGNLPNLTDDETNAAKWLHGHIESEQLTGSHAAVKPDGDNELDEKL